MIGEFRPYPKPERRRKKRRTDMNLSGWRLQVMAMYGWKCAACGWRPRSLPDRDKLEAHHLIFRSHCATEYVDDPRNGIALCGPWANNCHADVHEARKKIKPQWLPLKVIDCLQEQGLSWIDGQPVGTLAKYFAGRETRT